MVALMSDVALDVGWKCLLITFRVLKAVCEKYTPWTWLQNVQDFLGFSGGALDGYDEY